MRHLNQEEFRKFADQVDDLHKALWELSFEHYKDKMQHGGDMLLTTHQQFLEVAVDTFQFAEPFYRNMYEQKYKKEYEEKLREKEIAFNAAKKALIDTIERLSR